MSNEAKFTKGPWQMMPEECGKDYIRIRGTVLGGRYKVANVITPMYPGADDRELAETRANAAMIAAAPDLYEALEKMIARFTILTNDDYIYRANAVAALAKARGES